MATSQPAGVSSNDVSSSQLTQTAPVSWDTIPVTDVIEILGNGSVFGQEFILMHNCSARMKGRALGKISGDVSVEIFAPADVSAIVAVGVIPQNVGAAHVPGSVGALLACGGVVLRSNPTHGSDTRSLRFLPGISTSLKGETTTILTGKPPHIYLVGSARDAAGNAATNTRLHILVHYNLELSGYDWINPF